MSADPWIQGYYHLFLPQLDTVSAHSVQKGIGVKISWRQDIQMRLKKIGIWRSRALNIRVYR